MPENFHIPAELRQLPAKHAFDVLIDPRTREIFQNYSYGPGERNPDRLVGLGGTGSSTNRDDRRSLLQPGNWDTKIEPIPTSRQSVVNAGEDLRRFLEQEPVLYPTLGFYGRGANSNWAANEVANRAIQADRPGAPAMKLGIENPRWDDAPPLWSFPDWKRRP